MMPIGVQSERFERIKYSRGLRNGGCEIAIDRSERILRAAKDCEKQVDQEEVFAKEGLGSRRFTRPRRASRR